MAIIPCRADHRCSLTAAADGPAAIMAANQARLTVAHDAHLAAGSQPPVAGRHLATAGNLARTAVLAVLIVAGSAVRTRYCR